MITLWNTFFYKPLYNALVYMVDILPGNSLFVAVVLLTIIVRFIIAPLSYRSIQTQLKTKKLQPMLRDIKKNIKDKQEQARATMKLYKDHGVKPFAGFLLILVQLPIIIALYWVFKDGGVSVDPNHLYSFVSIPEHISFISFGIDLGQKSLLLAFLTGFTQYIYLSIAINMKKDPIADKGQSDQEKMMAMVGQSMKYMMPVMITIFAYTIGGAVALYWTTSNIFMIIQEISIQQKMKKKAKQDTHQEGTVTVIKNTQA